MELKTSNHPETPITYLPAGSGNDFARAAHLSKKPEELVNRLLQNLDYHPVGCGKFISSLKNNRPYYFVNNFGIGFDAFVVYSSNHQKMKEKLNKLHLGNLIYASNIINVLCRQDTFSVKVRKDNHILQYDDVYFVTTTNHPYFGGGFAILPSANIHSHHLDAVVVQKPSLHKFIRLFAKLLKDGSHVYDPHFHDIAGSKIEIVTSKPEYGQIDGQDQKKQKFKVAFQIDSFNLR